MSGDVNWSAFDAAAHGPRFVRSGLTWPQVPQREVVVGAVGDQLVPVPHQSGRQSDAVLLHLLNEQLREMEVSRPEARQCAGCGAQPGLVSLKKEGDSIEIKGATNTMPHLPGLQVHQAVSAEKQGENTCCPPAWRTA